MSEGVKDPNLNCNQDLVDSFYSNLGYAILAHALFEKFGGRYGSWQQWMLHEVLYPLGMTRTVLNNNRYLKSSFESPTVLIMKRNLSNN